MNNSLIQGKTWRWRRGFKPMPILSDEAYQQTRELFLSVQDVTEASKILKELKENGIHVDSKVTHALNDIVPSGTLIVYASMLEKDAPIEDIENIKKLENYIKTHGGNFPEKGKRHTPIGFFAKLFGRGGK